MEQVISSLNINSLLQRLKESTTSDDFKEILEILIVNCISLDINKREVSEETLERVITRIRLLEKISIFLFSEYNNVLRSYDETIMRRAMQLCAIASEKLGDYLEHVSEEKLSTLSYDQILNKQLKTYWRAAVAYTLSENPPNAIVIARKLKKILDKLEDSLPIHIRNLYKLSYFLLSRNFINNIQENIYDEDLIQIFRQLKEFIVNGDRKAANDSISLLNLLTERKLLSHKNDEFRYLKHLRHCVDKIIKNSVWTNLNDVFSINYILQLIKSSPSVLELWPNQLDIINNTDSFLRNDRIKRSMINFPTSGGKSLLAEFAIVKELEKDITKKCFYIVPTNALVYEVTKRLRDRFRRLGYKVSSSISGYEPDFIFGQYLEENVIVTTPEKLDMITRNVFSNDILGQTSLIIFDEFHKIQDRERGWLIEGNISFLINHPSYSNTRLLLLSAIIDNGAAVMEWVDGAEQCTGHFPSDWKPTVKLKGIVSWEYEEGDNGRWLNVNADDPFYKEGYRNYRAAAKIKYRISGKERKVNLFRFARYHHQDNNRVDRTNNMKTENFIMGVAQKLKNVGGSLIFFHTKDECEKFVRNYEPLFTERAELSLEVENLITYIEKRLGSDHLLTIGLNKGLVYHHGSLPVDIREALEDYFLKGLIKIMVCTTTLVEGVNFPIQNFIHSGRTYAGQRTLSPGDFKNIAGRAGRAYHSTFGQIVYINFYNNIIDEHFNYEDYSNDVKSSLLDDDDLFNALDEIERLEEAEQTTALLNLTSKSFVKSVLLFYNVLSPLKEDILGILGNTLFFQQAAPVKKEKIMGFSRNLFSYYDLQNPDELIKIQESGLSFNTYRTLRRLATLVVEEDRGRGGVIESVAEIITPEIYGRLLSFPESKKFDVKKSTSASRVIVIDDYNLFIDWIESNKSYKQLSEQYFFQVEENYRMSRLVEYVKDLFEFKLPWIIGTLCSMVIETLGNVEFYMYLPLFIKFGVNNSVDVNLFKLGLNSRETVKDLSQYIQTNTTHRTIDELRDFLKDAEPLIFLDTESNITPFEVRKLMSLSNNYKEITDVFNEYNYVEIQLAGTKFNLCQLPGRDLLLSRLTSGSELIIKRERDNFYDENAVEVYYSNNKIGYIPRKYNEEICYYLDLNFNYTLIVEAVTVVDPNRYIDVKMMLSFEMN
ncbi:DEAD/DEAH box helicase [Paenibacillus periandrae]|uniref:DEAD/DEAH box helicase n=1 Tax=Paenibacillus periandrae TaxID=1761741 RepID=UPI001F08A67A|nr:DEAD/DEAH box helicase [Paenibacillus periandrae]